jgi:undecaprenyl-diphosphatase
VKARLKSWQERIKEVETLAAWNAAVLVAAVVVFGLIAHHVAEGQYQSLEAKLIAMLRTGEPLRPIGPAWAADAARDITALGSVMVLTVVTGLVVGFLVLARRFGAALFLVAAAGGGQMVNVALKNFYSRERPDETFRWLEIHSLSFPSGHATASAVVYLTLAVLLARLTTIQREKIYVVAGALLLSFVVGLSRVYLGVHYPTDVIAGWALGIAWAEICWFAARMIGRRRLAKTG